MNVEKIISIIDHDLALPVTISASIGMVIGYLFSGRVEAILINFQYLLYSRWWAFIGILLVGVVGWVYFTIEHEKMTRSLILQLDTLNDLKKQAADDVSEEWKQVRSQYLSIEEMRASLQSGQQQLSIQWKQLSKERGAYLNFAEETASKIEKKSKILVGNLAETDPSKATRYDAENRRLIKHFRSAPVKMKTKKR